jgi:hypothetical protein
MSFIAGTRAGSECLGLSECPGRARRLDFTWVDGQVFDVEIVDYH